MAGERGCCEIHKEIVALGASFELPPQDLADLVASEGYESEAQISIPKRAAELGPAAVVHRPLLRLSRTFVQGYSIRVFRPQ